METDKIPTFKCLLIGDRGTGKSSLVKRLVTGAFDKKYVPSTELSIQAFDLQTKRGCIRFHIWDIAEQNQIYSLREVCYLQAQCAIIMFDVTARTSYENVRKWLKDLLLVCGKIPIAVCGNKIDLMKRQFEVMGIRYPHQDGMKYFEVSVLWKMFILEPFLFLGRSCTGDRALKLKSNLFLPPQVNMGAKKRKRMECEMEEETRVDLVYDDDEDGKRMTGEMQKVIKVDGGDEDVKPTDPEMQEVIKVDGADEDGKRTEREMQEVMKVDGGDEDAKRTEREMQENVKVNGDDEDGKRMAGEMQEMMKVDGDDVDAKRTEREMQEVMKIDGDDEDDKRKQREMLVDDDADQDDDL